MNDFKFVSHADEVLKELSKKEETIGVMIGLQAEGNAKIEIENHPRRVDTGNLRNSISNAVVEENEGMSVYIGTNVEYGPYVHEGTRHMQANRFLKNGVEKHQKDYYKIIEDGLKS